MSKPLNPELKLSKAEMKALGYQMVDLVAEHFDGLADEEPVKKASRKSMDWLLAEPIPDDGCDAGSLFEHVKENVFKNTALTTHPRFYSFVPSPSNYISALADFMASAYNIFTGAWVSSPGAAEIELITINWLLKLFGFPVREGGGLFVSGGSMANLIGLSVARRKKLDGDLSEGVVYFSDQTHSSVDRALRVLGFTTEQIRRLPSTENFKLSLNDLRAAVEEDRAKGLKPFCVVGNAGTTNTGTIDPLPELAMFCRQEKIWFHVDAAYGGGAILSERRRDALNGIEEADSITVDPHKWMYQPYEIGCIMVRNHEWMAETYRMNPEYLRDIRGNAEEINFYDYGIQLTRRFRALKFYMSVKFFGMDSFREAVASNFELADHVSELLESRENWEIVSPAQLAVINFRYCPAGISLSDEQLDELNQHISNRIIGDCYAMLATTILKNKKVLRMCLINPRITPQEIQETFERLETYAQEYLSELSQASSCC